MSIFLLVHTLMQSLMANTTEALSDTLHFTISYPQRQCLTPDGGLDIDESPEHITVLLQNGKTKKITFSDLLSPTKTPPYLLLAHPLSGDVFPCGTCTKPK